MEGIDNSAHAASNVGIDGAANQNNSQTLESLESSSKSSIPSTINCSVVKETKTSASDDVRPELS